MRPDATKTETQSSKSVVDDSKDEERGDVLRPRRRGTRDSRFARRNRRRRMNASVPVREHGLLFLSTGLREA
jgi:hypothetical protein